MAPANLLSITDLESRTGFPRHTVNYALRVNGIEPAGRVGIARVWREDQLPAIREALERTTRHNREAVLA